MGIYIKGMGMPKNCEQCLLFNRELDACNYLNYPVGYEYSDKRMEDCPLVEVPDHGDLVDRGALEDTVLRLNFPEEYPSDDVEESWEITRGEYKMIDNVLFQMPVVIPADKEE